LTRPAVLALAVALIVALALPSLASAGVPRDFVGITAEDVFAGDADYRQRNLESQSRLGVGSDPPDVRLVRDRAVARDL
jgi:hypothetical protein